MPPHQGTQCCARDGHITSSLRCLAFPLAFFSLVFSFRFQGIWSIEYARTLSRGVSTIRQQQNWSSMRIAIYLTTHFSEQHLFALETCWPPMVRKSQMLQHSDVMLFTAKEPNATLIDMAFGQTRGTVQTKLYENPGKQEGAILPVEEAIRHADEWFSDYDWIIRMNPDVLVLNDTALFPLMVDPNVDAILINCESKPYVRLHTDFFAIRPRALPPEIVKDEPRGAERHFTAQLKNVLSSGRYAWVPGARPKRPRFCRVVGETVLHNHIMMQNCTTMF